MAVRTGRQGVQPREHYVSDFLQAVILYFDGGINMLILQAECHRNIDRKPYLSGLLDSNLKNVLSLGNQQVLELEGQDSIGNFNGYRFLVPGIDLAGKIVRRR